MRAYLYVFLILLAIFGSIGGYLSYRYLEFQAMDFSPPPVTVAADQAVKEIWSQHLNAVGTIKAVRGIELKSETAGEISAIYFDSGDTVVEGQPLVQLDDKIERAIRNNQLANLELAEVFYERDRTLLKKKSIPQSQFDQSRANKETALAQLAEIEARLSRKVISAPFSGVIGLRKVDIGDYLSPGMVIANLQDLSRLEIDFSVPSRYRSSLREGLSLDVTVDAYPDRVYRGEVSAIDPRVDVSTRTILLRARFKEFEGLMPGMFGNLALDLGEKEPVITLPETAVTYSVQGNMVYVVKKDSQGMSVESRVIEVGPVREGRVAILSGVKSGELVVVAGQNKLYRDAEVIVDRSVSL
ncbi:MAG: efflux transporter periplasmic adaptor subunit [Gammaproteobacteria bacterium]|nr:efflux transporter periplasmic adaptor subunit [Gammaproteobacteria bacterium]